MFKILKYIKPKQWFQAAVSLCFIFTQIWLELRLPEYMAQITTLTQTTGSQMGEIIQAGVFMLLCTLGSVAAAVVVGYFAARIAAVFSADLRTRLFNTVDDFSLEEINRFSTDSLITRSTNDVVQVQMFIVMGFVLIVRAPVTAIWAISKIAGKGAMWTLTVAAAVGVIIVLFAILLVFVMPKFKQLQTMLDDLNRTARENLTGLRVVRAYNAEEYQGAKFEQANTRFTDTNLYVSRAFAIMFPFMTIIMSSMALAIYWIGAYLVDGASLAPNIAGVPEKIAVFSDMIVFMQYAAQVVMSFMMLIMVFMMLPRASVSARRINEVLDTQPVIKDPDGEGVKGGADAAGCDITFDNVSFKYPGGADYVLEDISFTAKAGQTVAIIGGTGAGKTTLINLIPRFYDTTKGKVLINGVDVREYKQETLRNNIGFVPQKAVVFKGTFSSNIAFGDNGRDIFSASDIERAVNTAQAADFVAEKGGFAAEVAQSGQNLSGGQKQRVSIARALCRKPGLLIFDDSFSALDYKTDRALRTELKKQAKDATVLIVAQRIGTIIDAQQILVLDEGRIAGCGTHKELLKNCEVYRQIALSQLDEKELE